MAVWLPSSGLYPSQGARTQTSSCSQWFSMLTFSTCPAPEPGGKPVPLGETKAAVGTEDQALTSSKDAAVARDGEKRTSQASRFSKVRAVSSKRTQPQARGGAGMGAGGCVRGPNAAPALRGLLCPQRTSLCDQTLLWVAVCLMCVLICEHTMNTLAMCVLAPKPQTLAVAPPASTSTLDSQDTQWLLRDRLCELA